MRLVGRCLWRYRVTVVSVVLFVAVIVLFGLADNQHDQDIRQSRALAAETKARTTESCLAAASARSALRQTFLALFDQIDAANVAAGRPPSPLIADLRAGVDKNLPPLTCPQDEGPIVIPQPTSPTN